jgi:hypothetical protein
MGRTQRRKSHQNTSKNLSSAKNPISKVGLILLGLGAAAFFLITVFLR